MVELSGSKAQLINEEAAAEDDEGDDDEAAHEENDEELEDDNENEEVEEELDDDDDHADDDDDNDEDNADDNDVDDELELLDELDDDDGDNEGSEDEDVSELPAVLLNDNDDDDDEFALLPLLLLPPPLMLLDELLYLLLLLLLEDDEEDDEEEEDELLLLILLLEGDDEPPDDKADDEGDGDDDGEEETAEVLDGADSGVMTEDADDCELANGEVCKIEMDELELDVKLVEPEELPTPPVRTTCTMLLHSLTARMSSLQRSYTAAMSWFTLPICTSLMFTPAKNTNAELGTVDRNAAFVALTTTVTLAELVNVKLLDDGGLNWIDGGTVAPIKARGRRERSSEASSCCNRAEKSGSNSTENVTSI